MKNQMILKTYDIDYSFIISNYLDKDLWNKEWTLLTYKTTKISLSLYNIKCQKPVNIVFRITVETDGEKDSNLISYDMENSNLNVLKKQINGGIRTGIAYCERQAIEKEDAYKDLQAAINEEEDRLRQIAEDYLDDNNITLDDVREAYIDRYVSDNAHGNSIKNDYISNREFMVFVDLWLVFSKIIDDESLYETIIDKSQNVDGFDKLLTEINEFIENMNTEEDSDEYRAYVEDMQYNLVGV